MITIEFSPLDLFGHDDRFVSLRRWRNAGNERRREWSGRGVMVGY